MNTEPAFSLVLRLAGPLQSWGGRSQFNRRDTMGEPTKSGILGLLAAADGRRRQDPIEDLLKLSLGVRTDQPGSLLRDYHTVSDYRGRPLLSAAVTAKGRQKPTSPAKHTHVTQRFYLQDAVFVAAVSGPVETLRMLGEALWQPAFPLALGRRACPPAFPLVLADTGVEEAARKTPDDPKLWAGDVLDALRRIPWQASDSWKRSVSKGEAPPSTIDLPVTVDDPDGDDLRADVPFSFDPLRRGFASRRVRQEWVRPPGPDGDDAGPDVHDPFALLGW